MDYVVVAYYTRDTGYEAEVRNLVASLEQFKLPYDIVGIKNQGSWQRNTHYKPYFIRQMLFKHFPKDIVYVDADAIFKSHPHVFDSFTWDIGFVYHPSSKEVLSGTLYLSNNPEGYRVIETWQRLCYRNQDSVEQALFHLALIENKFLLKAMNLPLSYCKIFDDPTIADPVIEHYQASRRFRNEVDGK